jgi:hypothetical protein
MYTALVVPPLFVDVSRHQPRRVLTYSCPITGATGGVLLSLTRFLLAAPSFFHSVLTYGLSTSRPFSGRSRRLLLVSSRLLRYAVFSLPLKAYSEMVELSSVAFRN